MAKYIGGFTVTLALVTLAGAWCQIPGPGAPPPGPGPTPPPGWQAPQPQPPAPEPVGVRILDALRRPITVDLRDAPLTRALETLSGAAGIPIRLAPGWKGEIHLTLNVQELPLVNVLELVANQTGAIIRPMPAIGGIVLAPGPRPRPGADRQSVWAPSWPWSTPGQPRLPQPGQVPALPAGPLAAAAAQQRAGMHLMPYAVTALDANRFLVMSINLAASAPVRMDVGGRVRTMREPLAILTLYRIEKGKIVQESSALHQIPAAELERLIREFRASQTGALR